MKASAPERELAEWVQKRVDIITGYRPAWLGGKELDIYVPSHSFAIEYNGTFWHSLACNSKFKTYHEEKYNVCKENGVDLIHVFEFENIRSWQKVIEKYLRHPSAYQIGYLNIKRTFRRHTSYGKSFILPGGNK